MKYLVTGAAGFIGYHTVLKLLLNNHQVVGIDNLNHYYDVSLKQARLSRLNAFDDFSFSQLDLADNQAIADLFAKESFERVIHLAAQAGVRYSLENPHAYADANLVGHLNILQGCRQTSVKHLVYASSSSVYGLNGKMPFSESDAVDHPVSLYAASKKANELMSHSYSHLYNLPTSGLRFFTVYGPWGRPDMAPMKFAKAILAGEPIDVYNQGDLARDFTYIDDIVEGVCRIANVIPEANENWQSDTGSAADSSAPYRIYNIGNGKPVALMDFINTLETGLNKTAKVNFMPMQPGDVYKTWADTQLLEQATGYQPQVAIDEGVKQFADWYLSYYH